MKSGFYWIKVYDGTSRTRVSDWTVGEYLATLGAW
jgi:hypothetical protein